MSQPMKACPRCGAIQPLNAEVCHQCGHQFRTQFPNVPNTQLVPTPGMVPYPPQPYVARPFKDRGTAMLLEILLGFFGFLGFGWIYAGNTATGLILLFGLLAWNIIIMVPVSILTLGFGVCCALPINWGALILSAIMLNSYTHEHPELFGP